MGKSREPGPVTGLQLDVLRVLWARPDSTVQDVRDALAGRRKLAPTTVATLLKRLRDRGLVDTRRDGGEPGSRGRAFVWHATVDEADLLQRTVDEVAETVFRGDVAAFAAQLLRSDEVGTDELDQIRSLIEARERELEGERPAGDESTGDRPE